MNIHRFLSRNIVLILPLVLILLVAMAGVFATIVEYRPWGVPEVLMGEYQDKLKAIALTNQAKAGEHSGPMPSFHHDNRHRKLGEVVSGIELTQVFKLQNLGDAPLSFTDASSSDDAIRYEFSKSLIPPGDEAELSVFWDTTADAGDTAKWVRVKSNDPLQRTVTFILQADIRQALVLPNELRVGAHDFGDTITNQFIVAGETSPDFSIEEIESSLPLFDWLVVESYETGALKDHENAKVAHKVLIRFVPDKYGPIQDELVFRFKLDGELVEKKSSLTGRIRSPIAFAHPDIHSNNGLNIGTIKSNERSEIAVSVRQRSTEPRALEVLDHYPKELEVSLQPLDSVVGGYRLVISVPQGTPTMEFNLNNRRGFVSVGDPNDKDFSNWFPLLGVVIGP